RIQNEPVAAEELELAISYLTGSFALGFERSSRRVNAMISAHRNGLPDTYIADLLRDIKAVTIADVQSAAAKHLFPQNACVVASGPIKAKELADIVG
ncbi:MAG: zinc protease, partial [Planctomycetota bacterium]